MRELIEVPTPRGGWEYPWPNVAQIARLAGPEDWTLVGGLMVQLHAAARGIAQTRVTSDVDLVVHVETARGRMARLERHLVELGYSLDEPSDPRRGLAHRFRRSPEGGASSLVDDVVDVVVADHAAPRAKEKLGGYAPVSIDGGTQALRRTVNARLVIGEEEVLVSVPDALGAVILKSAAHQADSRNRDRHLFDAAMLLACMADPFADRDRMTSGSDGPRVRHLVSLLGDDAHPAWLALDDEAAREGRAALRILSS